MMPKPAHAARSARRYLRFAAEFISTGTTTFAGAATDHAWIGSAAHG
jgi:hypothetical protein